MPVRAIVRALHASSLSYMRAQMFLSVIHALCVNGRSGDHILVLKGISLLFASTCRLVDRVSVCIEYTGWGLLRRLVD